MRNAAAGGGSSSDGGAGALGPPVTPVGIVTSRVPRAAPGEDLLGKNRAPWEKPAIASETRPCFVCTFRNPKGALQCESCSEPLDGISKLGVEVSCPRCTATVHPELAQCELCGHLLRPGDDELLAQQLLADDERALEADADLARRFHQMEAPRKGPVVAPDAPRCAVCRAGDVGDGKLGPFGRCCDALVHHGCAERHVMEQAAAGKTVCCPACREPLAAAVTRAVLGKPPDDVDDEFEKLVESCHRV